ncbi:MAG: O-antigen ligase family protein [Prolixibacteraceae bacterium]|jgi:hypothetical protein|nr:O-antigen ligase family protein [Prolixibacteraceae bacterium]
MYYVYNAFFLWVNISLIELNYVKYRKAVLSAICVSVVSNIMFIILGVGKIVGNRAVIFFNDPNQMGFFFFMLSMIYFFLKGRNIVIYLSLFVLVLSSASRGCLISICLFYFFLIIFFYYKSSLIRALKYTFTSIVLIMVLGFVFSNKLIYQYEYLNNRLEENSDDDSVMSRGWHRLYEFTDKCVLGYGEGGNKQFKYGEDDLETHSTWANLILSYGIVGLGLFCFVVQCYRKNIFSYILLSPLFLHGIIQVDSRQTTFWLVIFLSGYTFQNNFARRI